ncbi:MAG: type II toxin-antitoxin system MqsA family antitoxin [Deltaproteobacteria bacterium]|nr:type II toxin-antitoxin system MqsA family antitoxin [Deltaproteobacteria bacterium]
MKCVICKQGETWPGTATVTLERASLTLVVKNVPARVCQNCGEEYVDEEIATQLLRTAEEVARAGAQVDIREYMAA